MKKVNMSKVKPPFRIVTKVGPSRLYLQELCEGGLDEAEREFARYLDIVCRTVYSAGTAWLDSRPSVQLSLLSGRAGRGIRLYELQVRSTNINVPYPVRIDETGGLLNANRLIKRQQVDLSVAHVAKPADRLPVVLPDDMELSKGQFAIRIGHNKMEFRDSFLQPVRDAFVREIKRAIDNRRKNPSTDMFMSCMWYGENGEVKMLSEVVVGGLQKNEGWDGFVEMPWGYWELKPLQELSGGKEGIKVQEPEPELEKEPVKEACAAETPESVKPKMYEVGIDRMARVSASADKIISMCDSIKRMLLDKNRKYGDSALNPRRVFSKADSVEQLKVRIDDKLSRIQNMQADEDEDVYKDLVGYLVLLMIAMKEKKDA